MSPVGATARAEPSAWSDPWWARRYGARRGRLPWAIGTAQAIRWFNWATDLREVLPLQPNGYARATWRGERTPSVAHRPEKRWLDYGARAWPEQKGGDVFEAYVLKFHGGDLWADDGSS